MKQKLATRLVVAACLAGILAISALPVSGQPVATPTPPPSASAQRSAADLQSLAAPIALYPDPLIATLLPASVYPLEFVQAARFVANTNNWPLPIPMVQRERRWFFETAAGEVELLNRRIGRNELAVLQVMRAYVDAQRECASKDRDADEVLEYAQKFASSEGKTDGLYWPTELNDGVSPLGPMVAEAQGASCFGEALQNQGPTSTVPRFLVQDPDTPGQTRTGREVQLPHQRKYDWRLCVGGVSGGLW